MAEKTGKLFKCSECKMVYKTMELAEKCGQWRNEHNSCNPEIIRHAVKE